MRGLLNLLTVINPTNNRTTDYDSFYLAREARNTAKMNGYKAIGWSLVVIDGRPGVSLRVECKQANTDATKFLHVAL